MDPVAALTIAGSDSGGAAGVQADLKTFAALGVYGCSAITAVTAQNTLGVKAIAPIAPSMVADQIVAVLDDTPIRAVKTGMLATAAIVEVVAAIVGATEIPLVVDPVIVATSGARLLALDALDAYRTLLCPLATLITPNAVELEVLLDLPAGSLATTADLAEAAQTFAARTNTTVLAKSGHLDPVDGELVDVLATTTTARALPHRAVSTTNTHGTGCTLSAALAARLALGDDVDRAVDEAVAYVQRAIVGAATWRLGAGHGPLDHFGWGPRAR